MIQKKPNISSRLALFNKWLSDALKRSFDVVVSLAILVFTAPFWGLIALAIRRDSPGPIFYRGTRMGRGGRSFHILKFRTMYETPESYRGPHVTAHDDPRVTRLGRWLRATKLNEFPQFWNVLKGEMSLVGPRPEDPTLAKTWPREAWAEVLSVRPGITSPASVQYRNEENLLNAGNVINQYIQQLIPEKIRLDQLYVRYRSFWLDLDVLFWTFSLLMPKIGAYSLPEELLFVGPVTRLIRRYLNWFTIDLIVTFIALASAGLIWRTFGPLNVGWPMAIGLALGFALLFSVMGLIMGVNRISWSKATDAEALDLLPPWILATTIAMLVNFFLRIFPLGMVLVASALALAGFITLRYRWRILASLFDRNVRYLGRAWVTRERVLVIGTGPTAQLATWLFDHSMNSQKFWVVGLVDNDLLKQRMRIFGVEVLGTCKDLPHLVKQYDVGVIILADQNMASQECRSIIDQCARTTAKLVILPDILGTFNSLVAAAGVASRRHTDINPGFDSPCLNCLANYAPLNKLGAKAEFDHKIEAEDLMAAD